MGSTRSFLAAVAALALASCAAEDPPGEPTFEGLSGPVEIRVDDLGIPHIYAQTDADAGFAAGYQMASDRLFQMDLTLRRAKGTRAEVFGDRFLDDDRLARLIDFARWGRKDTERLRAHSPEDHRLILAWRAGVNRRIDEVRSGAAPLPYGFGPGELDYLPEPWEVADPLTVGVLLLFGNDGTLQNELLASVMRKQLPELLDVIPLLRPYHPVVTVPEELLPAARAGAAPTPRPPSAAATSPMAPEQMARALRRMRERLSAFDVGGSNNWAVHGSLTANGRPLIAGDPHQPLDSPSLFYAQHLNSADAGGTLDVIGWSFVGAPAVHLGHNRHVAWTATSNYGDVLDLWEVQREGPDAIRLGDQVLPIGVREEIIRVRQRDGAGAPIDEWREVSYRVKDVGDDYGVLLDDSILPASLVTLEGGLLLMKWTGFDGTDMAQGWLAMNRARSVDEVEEAVLGLRSGSFNFVFADQDDIVYRVGLDVPDRGDPAARQMPWMVADGNDPATVWTGAVLDPDRLPHGRNPARGWLATANNDPWGFTHDGSVENDPWYYGAFYAVGFRARRIDDELGRLAGAGGITAEDMQALQLDVHSVLADDLVPLLQQAWANAETDPALAEWRGREDLATLMELLGAWDRQMRRDSAAALPFHYTALFASARALSDDFDFLFDSLLDASATWVLKAGVLALSGVYERGDEVLQEGRDAILLSALADTADLLTERFGGVDEGLYTWGEVHGTVFDNAFGGRLEYGFVPTDGGEDTVNVSGSRLIRDGRVAARLESGIGAIYRMVAGFAEDGTPEAQAHFPIGNSGDPDSPFWDSQVEDWSAGVYHALPFRRADVEARTATVLTLE